ncbi:hypothetical protein WA171_001224, partial [Blastocystis sp. BT1]
LSSLIAAGIVIHIDHHSVEFRVVPPFVVAYVVHSLILNTRSVSYWIQFDTISALPFLVLFSLVLNLFTHNHIPHIVLKQFQEPPSVYSIPADSFQCDVSIHPPFAQTTFLILLLSLYS